MRTPSVWISVLSRHVESRRGWLGVALLVGLCLTTVAVSLDVSHRQMVLSDEILSLHQAWSERLARYGRMGQLALAISAPSNEVFDSGDLRTESARSRRAHVAFDAEMDSARQELVRLRPGDSSSLLLKDLEAVETATDSMTVDVGRTFTSYDVGTPPDVAVINGHLAGINEALDRLERHAREAQGLESKKLLASSAFLHRLAAILVPLSVLMVVIVLIARRGSLRARNGAQESERTPDALHESGMRIGLVLDAALDAVITLDGSGRITGWNAQAEKAFGHSPDEMRGSRFSETVIAPRHRQALDRGLLRFLEAGDASILNRRLEITALDRDGREFPIELAITPVRDGDATLFSAFLRDITERRRADDQLRRLARVACQTANGVLITDPLGRTEWANEAFVRIRGLSLEDLHGKTLDALWRGPCTEAAALDRMVEGVRSGTGFRVELAMDGREGGPCWIEVEATPVFDEGGTLFQFIAIVTDVTERKRAEAALRESEARPRAIIEGAADGIVTIDELGSITTANPAAERIFGYWPGELIGQDIRTLMPALALGPAGRGPGGELESGPWSVTAGSRELEGRRKNGSPFPIELSVSEVRLDGPRLWTGIVRDVTHRRKAEALRVGQDHVFELLASEAPLAGPLTELIQMVEDQQPGTVCMILTLDPGQTRLRMGAAPSLPDELARAVESVEIGPLACLWGAAAYLRKRVIVEDTAIHPLWAGFRRLAVDHGLRSSWAEPILSGSGQTLGVFVTFRRRVHTPGSSELELVSSAAQVAGVAIEGSRAAEAPNGLATGNGEGPGRAAPGARTHAHASA